MLSIESISLPRLPGPVHCPPRVSRFVEHDVDAFEPAPVPVRVPAKATPKRSRGARVFDGVTDFAGTPYAFASTMLALTGWGIACAVLKFTDNCQIFLQDASSIQCYISDTLLMRQQHNQTKELVGVMTGLLGGNVTAGRLIDDIKTNGVRTHPLTPDPTVDAASLRVVDDAVHLPSDGNLDRAADVVGNFAGSLWAQAIYAPGIGVWLGVGGPRRHWDNEWQLYINTAVALQLTIVSMFLQNTRRRHMHYVRRCTDAIAAQRERMVNTLRAATGDTAPDPEVTIDPAPRNKFERGIDGYSNLVASGAGAVVSAVALAVWLGVGPVMGWSSDWWLMSGTYTGLLGFFDGPVLRNVHRREGVQINTGFQQIEASDRALCNDLGISFPEPRTAPPMKWPARWSSWMSQQISTSAAVGMSMGTVLALIGVASGMRWNETGQLICNTPTMILEGAFMLMLIEAHNTAHANKRRVMHDILERSVALADGVQNLLASRPTGDDVADDASLCAVATASG